MADVLLIPVGGLFTIDPVQATGVAEQIKPKILIPMHFKTEKCGFSIAPVEDFLKGKTNIKRPKGMKSLLTKQLPHRRRSRLGTCPVSLWKNIASIYCSPREQIASIVQGLADRISEDYPGRDLVLV